jgi:hypothetical protein
MADHEDQQVREPNRISGTHTVNTLMRLDDYTKTTALTDPIGGSVSFSDTRVDMVKV